MSVTKDILVRMEVLALNVRLGSTNRQMDLRSARLAARVNLVLRAVLRQNASVNSVQPTHTLRQEQIARQCACVKEVSSKRPLDALVVRSGSTRMYLEIQNVPRVR